MPLSRQWDALFRAHADQVPVPYLRALAKRESNMDPLDQEGLAWGLMQVHKVVVDDHNERTGEGLTLTDMLDPDRNVELATATLNRIVNLYQTRGIIPSWQDPNYIALVTAGWNSGYSQKAGTTRVLDYLRERGLPQTWENVWKYSRAAGATQYLDPQRYPKRKAWQRSVVNTYMREIGATPPAGGGSGKGTLAWLALGILYLLS